jgi:hypothetical protein
MSRRRLPFRGSTRTRGITTRFAHASAAAAERRPAHGTECIPGWSAHAAGACFGRRPRRRARRSLWQPLLRPGQLRACLHTACTTAPRSQAPLHATTAVSDTIALVAAFPRSAFVRVFGSRPSGARLLREAFPRLRMLDLVRRFRALMHASGRQVTRRTQSRAPCAARVDGLTAAARVRSACQGRTSTWDCGCVACKSTA